MKTAAHTVYISVGSNIGNKRDHCRNGIAELCTPRFAVLIDQSPYYRTEPVDYQDQDWFVNAVVKIETAADPFDLIARLKAIETENGRCGHTLRFGPRELDLDILLYDDQIIRTERLTVPHPRMHKRRFVLQPFCDIDPGVIHPVLGKPMTRLLADLDPTEQKVTRLT